MKFKLTLSESFAQANFVTSNALEVARKALNTTKIIFLMHIYRTSEIKQRIKRVLINYLGQIDKEIDKRVDQMKNLKRLPLYGLCSRQTPFSRNC